jgi:hypothetical protein
MFSVLTIIIVALLVNFSCSKDTCKDTHCLNGATCNGGACYCADGFEGVQCQTASRQKFIGNWTQTRNNGTQFIVNAFEGSGVHDVVLNNFNGNFSQPVSAYESHSDSLIIPTQGTPNGVVAGYGVYAKAISNPTVYGNITLHYTITDPTTGTVTTVDTIW